MEVKKNPNADLNRKTGFFFSIALLITMSLVLFAFEFRHHETPIEEIVQRNTNDFDNITVPITQIEQPPIPKVVAPVIIEVKDDEEIEHEVKIDLDIERSPDPYVEPIVVVTEEPEETDVIVSFAEQSAAPRGGFSVFYKYLSDNIKYPAQAQRMQTHGKVFVEFVVNRDGSIVDAKVIKGIGDGCDEEALRVIQKAPAWSPGKQRGKPVRQKMVVPVTFILNN